MRQTRFRHWKTETCDAVRAVGVTAATGWHDHAHMILGLVDRGRLDLGLRTGPVSVVAGQGFVVPAGTAHRLVPHGGADYRALAIGRQVGVAGAIRTGAYRLAFGRCFADAIWARQVDVHRVLVLMEKPGPEACEPRSVRRVRNIVLEDAVGRHPLAALSDVVGVSPSHLQRLFVKTIGLSPLQSQICARLRLARALMLVGLPLADVAAASGFADQSHMNRFFRRTMGVPPGEYVRQVAEPPVSKTSPT